MPDQTQIAAVIAALGLVAPAIFLAVVAAAAIRRNRGHGIGSGLGSLLAFLGGASLGTGIPLMVDEPLLVLPLPILIIVAAASLWRRRQRSYAAWLVIGFVLPWTVLWGSYVALLVFARTSFEPLATWLGFLAGFVPVVVGLVVVARGDPPPPAPSADAPAGQPGARSYANLATAILEPAMIGPFGFPDVVALVAFILSWGFVAAVLSLLLPGRAERILVGDRPELLISLVAGIAAAVVAAEVQLRAYPTRGRRAFEAFSWYGDQELAKIRQLTGRTYPTAKRAVGAWLEKVPDTDELAWVRAESLSYLGRHDEARATAQRIPASTAEERAFRKATLDLIDFMAGGEGDFEGLRASVDEIPDPESDAHLRGEVMLAAADVRRRMADGRATPGDAIEPLLAVRERLGARADGQMGRALRTRLLRAYVVAAVVVGVVFEVASRVEGA